MRPRSDRETYFRRKSVVLTERDELAFSRVLREFAPGVMFFEDGRRGNSKPRLVDNIPSSREWHVWIALPSPGQEHNWRKSLNKDGMPVVTPRCSIDLRRSEWVWPDPAKKWAFDPPLLDWGELSVSFPCGDEQMRRFAMQLVRKITKVTTFGKRRYGLDACRWSQSGGKERRGIGAGELIDPNEKIELNKYYEDSFRL